MAVVKDILVKSEAASIRVNQAVVAGNVGLAMIKFRRNLFKGRARRAAEASASAVNGGNDSSTVAAKEAASTSKPKVSGGFKGLVAGAVARGGTGAESGNQQQAQAASPSQAAEKVKLAAIPTVAATKPKGAFGSLVSAVKSSHPPSSTPPATPASGNAGIATSSSASSASASASPSKSPTGAPATGPSLAKRTKSSETFNPASLLSAPPKPPSRPGA
ncbi:hypothetical protein BCR44DRAFT_1443709 [Catenaria anguillulae PL171]|uniref:Uncharacterized protein n=1 Tax=Catenaria anguillulae PL171 TaxID=765915 RepID=A0A1Y2H8C9_9FUNG|nr:hypothetical protein BCR44DRAFT_1443709 [Catenaria anguillulae PL171]